MHAHTRKKNKSVISACCLLINRLKDRTKTTGVHVEQLTISVRFCRWSQLGVQTSASFQSSFLEHNRVGFDSDFILNAMQLLLKNIPSVSKRMIETREWDEESTLSHTWFVSVDLPRHVSLLSTVEFHRITKRQREREGNRERGSQGTNAIGDFVTNEIHAWSAMTILLSRHRQFDHWFLI